MSEIKFSVRSLPPQQFQQFLERPLDYVDLSVDDPRQPGKFEACENVMLGERLYDVANEGGSDEEAGNVDESGVWIGRIGRFVLIENDRGSVTYMAHPSVRAAQSNFSILAGDVADGDDVVIPPAGRMVAFPPIGERLSSEGMTKLLEEIKASAVPGSCVREYRALQGAIIAMGIALELAGERDRELVVPEGL